jgi:hypothetical protein
MIAADIKERLTAVPFRAFRVRASSGAVYDVTRPFLVAMMKSKIFIAAANSDDWSELSYLHISALESIPGRGRAGGGDSRGRKRRGE